MNSHRRMNHRLSDLENELAILLVHLFNSMFIQSILHIQGPVRTIQLEYLITYLMFGMSYNYVMKKFQHDLVYSFGDTFFSEEKRAYNSVDHPTPKITFWRIPLNLNHLMRSLCFPYPLVISINFAKDMNGCFIIKANVPSCKEAKGRLLFFLITVLLLGYTSSGRKLTL